MTTRMWEARAVTEPAAAALVTWLLDVGIPALSGQPGYQRAEVFSGGEARVVVLVWWQGQSRDVPEPPPELLARPAHSWDFTSVGTR